MSTKELLTTGDIAKMAGTSDAYIRMLLIDGKQLRGEKVGRQWIVRRAEAERWLKERERNQR